MQPYDGNGYGKSPYWTWQAVSIARQNGEECKCWDTNIPKITFRDDGTYAVGVQCLIKGNDCKEGFLQTEKELTEKFMELYK